MASGFHRSVSLPLPKDSIPPEKPYHVRSASLPCRSHPLISQLEDEVRATRAWQSAEPEGDRSSPWLRSGLIRLELLHLALDDLLQVPKTRDSLRGSHGLSSGLAENLLDDFLVFADTYGSFRSALISLQELQSEAQVAIRRGDRAHLSSVARSIRKIEKEVAGVSSALRKVSKSSEPAAFAAASSASSTADAELGLVLREVKQVTVSVSASVFQRAAAAMASVTAAVAPKSSSSWTALKRRLSLAASSKKNKGSSEETDEEVVWASIASATLQSLEKCVGELESGSERVFRSLMNSRVSLLNILTP
ncbi:hypothetical protein Taro_048132 [Colocasia esculenta]|uniref:Uncharacterized protein n=1 Tax=Colocasia esculenta TaxID=4460 RepID=A0A843X7P1_COLES|nr:hypothetical protein [Colocasia esculenta]